MKLSKSTSVEELLKVCHIYSGKFIFHIFATFYILRINVLNLTIHLADIDPI